MNEHIRELTEQVLTRLSEAGLVIHRFGLGEICIKTPSGPVFAYNSVTARFTAEDSTDTLLDVVTKYCTEKGVPELSVYPYSALMWSVPEHRSFTFGFITKDLGAVGL